MNYKINVKNVDQLITRSKIRNFSIIAHIDHGKSTLADRFLEKSIIFNPKKKTDRILDSLNLEKKRGITIKLNPVNLLYFSKISNEYYHFNLLDTPGHYDFMYEVFSSLQVCDSVILLIDGTKGIQSQTIAYFQIAKKKNLFILPVINKLDVASDFQLKNTKEDIVKLVGCDENLITCVSAKTGENVGEILEKIIKYTPCPSSDNDKFFKAVIFDLMYDKYDGAIIYIKVVQGIIEKNKIVKLNIDGKWEDHKIEQLGVKTPEKKIRDKLYAGEIGWIIIRIKDLDKINSGDEIIDYELKSAKFPLKEEIKKELKSNVYCNIFPRKNTSFLELKKVLENLNIQDKTFSISFTDSKILGSGFVCGFLGSLHKEIICQRIKEEYNCEIMITPSSTVYRIFFSDDTFLECNSLKDIDQNKKIKMIKELFITLEIIFPKRYMKIISDVCEKNNGFFVANNIEAENFCKLIYDMPYSSFISDFTQKIKSLSQGYASFIYKFSDFRVNDLEKIDILINGEIISDFSFVCNSNISYKLSKDLCFKLKNLIVRQNFPIVIQATNGRKKIICRENISALKKNVTGNLYGGDRTRKMKLWNKQKKGKTKMKKFGKLSLDANTISKLFN